MIAFADVSMTYRSVLPPRPVHALKGCTYEFRRGEVTGIAGPNGAGKTTLLGLAMGFMRPTGGHVTIEGTAPRTYIERRGVSYLPELVHMPDWWRVEGALRRLAVLSGVPAAQRRQRVAEALATLGLEEHRGKRVKQLSKGNLQRLGIAQALLGDADFVVLDEPTHGLDPVWTQRFRDIVAGLRRPDRCVVVASHNLDELERIADRVLILDQGRVTHVADLRSRAEEGRDVYLLALVEEHPAVHEAFPEAVRHPEVKAAATWEVAGTVEDLNLGLQVLLARGARVRAFHPRESRLESIFHEAVGDDA